MIFNFILLNFHCNIKNININYIMKDYILTKENDQTDKNENKEKGKDKHRTNNMKQQTTWKQTIFKQRRGLSKFIFN